MARMAFKSIAFLVFSHLIFVNSMMGLVPIILILESLVELRKLCRTLKIYENGGIVLTSSLAIIPWSDNSRRIYRF